MLAALGANTGLTNALTGKPEANQSQLLQQSLQLDSTPATTYIGYCTHRRRSFLTAMILASYLIHFK
jgi:hypothetical protein